MESTNVYSNWEGSTIYESQNSSLVLKKNKQQIVVEKKIFINQLNKKYSEMQTSIMKEIKSPYVVKYLNHNINPKENSLYIYMKYYTNGDLENFLVKNPNLSFKKRLRMFIDVLVGLMELHSRFIIHRDLKLKNIFVDQNERCVVGDLGIATVTEKSAISSLGTLGNQAPQVYNAENYDQKVDMWAAGIIAYQIFNKIKNGTIPYPFPIPQKSRSALLQSGGGVNYKNYVAITSKVSPFDQDIPPTLVDLILRMLKNNPKERISWIQFYKSSVLVQLYESDPEVESERLIPFKAEYERMADSKAIIKEYIEYIQYFREVYFYKLQRILNKQNIKQLQTNPKYKKLKDNLHDLHLFYYLLMRKALNKYDYIKQKRIYRAIIDLKDFMKQVKNIQYYIEIRINIWLRETQEKEISKNTKYLKNEYFYGLQEKFDKLLYQYQL